MSLSEALATREYQKFSDVSGNTCVNVAVKTNLVPSEYDTVLVDYPSATTESYAFKQGGVSGTLIATVNLTYSDSTKANLTLVVKS